MLLACSTHKVREANFVELFSVDFAGANVLQPETVRLPHYYPATSVRFLDAGTTSLVATAGDHVRIWSTRGELQRLLQHERASGGGPGPCTPITGMDASPVGTSGAHLATCDVDGVCSLWDVERGAKQHALDLSQPLCDVAFGPNGLLAAAGASGDCFLIDPRSTGNVSVLAPRQRMAGPARIAWGAARPDLFAVSWQGECGGVALYSGWPGRQQVPQLFPAGRATCADLQWSPAFPELLCCADESGVVEAWQFPDSGLESAALARHPAFRWEAAAGRSTGRESCTALALSPEVQPGQHAVILATTPDAEAAAASHASGSLWIAALPVPAKPTATLGLGPVQPLATLPAATPASAPVVPTPPGGAAARQQGLAAQEASFGFLPGVGGVVAGAGGARTGVEASTAAAAQQPPPTAGVGPPSFQSLEPQRLPQQQQPFTGAGAAFGSSGTGATTSDILRRGGSATRLGDSLFSFNCGHSPQPARPLFSH